MLREALARRARGSTQRAIRARARGRCRVLRPQRRRRRRVRRRAARDARLPGRPVLLQVVARATSTAGSRTGPGDGRAAAPCSTTTGASPTGATSVWGTTHRRGRCPAAPPNLLAGEHLDPPLALPRAEPVPRQARPGSTATRRRSTSFRARASSSTSSRRCRCAPRRCAASAPTPTSSRSSRSWTSSPRAAAASPLAFRLAHLDDPRARAVLEAAAERRRLGRRAPRRWPAAAAASRSRATRTRAAYAAVVVALRVDDATAAIALERDRDRGGLRRGRRSRAARPTSSRAARCSRRAGRSRSRSAFDATAVTSVDWDELSDPALQRGARGRDASCSTDPGSRSSERARRRRVRRPRRSPTRWSTRSACACATRRSRRRACARRRSPRREGSAHSRLSITSVAREYCSGGTTR